MSRYHPRLKAIEGSVRGEPSSAAIATKKPAAGALEAEGARRNLRLSAARSPDQQYEDHLRECRSPCQWSEALASMCLGSSSPLVNAMTEVEGRSWLTSTDRIAETGIGITRHQVNARALSVCGYCATPRRRRVAAKLVHVPDKHNTARATKRRADPLPAQRDLRAHRAGVEGHDGAAADPRSWGFRAFSPELP
jgi:hypothetical protein